ncbi:hypothetical protein PVK06_041343 [Gossypium arboreum]|uniref:(+)-delta-cadinene synthase n=1 Tax=Gossypium arboreum TaxID=29729 RepID=A0ABR0N8J8_GOSAR|nr:hypothetical protein PVK06_041343 [Gossypium arboreum]
MKEQTRRMIKLAMDDRLLHLIDTIKREIEEALHNIYEHDDKDDQTLEATSLRFRLLRDDGFNVQCDMFSKFKDNEGNFKKSLTSDMEADMFSKFKDNEGNFKKSLTSVMEGLLELYEAAHLCVHGEDILEEALAFVITHLGLEKAAGTIEYPLLASVSHALYGPIRKSWPRLKARRFIPIYGENASHDKMLLKFAELDFRQILTKLIDLTSITDDIYDAYGAFEELQLLTDAIANTK